MNMLQRNPRDPKHREFHDGEYEYWPAKAPGSGRSISFPAACLIAAIVASALLAAALTVLYSQTSPKAIYEDFAIVNVNIYNNVENLDIRYALSPESDPDTVLQEGALEHSKDTLNLQGLTPGTQYILQYSALKDGVWEPIGDFQFRTPGDPPEQPEPPLTTPTEPTSVPESTKPTEATTETTEPTTETTEATTEPEDPPKPAQPPTIWTPQKPKPTPKPAPKPTPEPSTPEPSTPEPSTPEPDEPSEPYISDVTYFYDFERADITGSSGLDNVFYLVQQTHSFQDIPDGAYTVTILQDGEDVTDISNYEASTDRNGILSVVFTGRMIAIGETSTTRVILTWEDGTTAERTLEIVAPSMTGVDLTVTKNADNTHTFTVTVTADSNSEYKLAFETLLYLTYGDPTGVSVEMGDPVEGVYTGTYIAPVTSDEVEERAYLYISAIWDMAGTPEDVYLSQSDYAYFYYTP